MNTFKTTLFLASIATMSLVGCHKDDVHDDDENELITTVNLKFTEQGTTNTLTFSWRDTDGDGGAAPTIQPVQLRANRTYKLDVEFLNESVMPAENKTNEVKEEADEHLVVYTANPSSLLTYTASDKDSRNLAIGLTGSARTGAAGTGTLRVQLRHQPPASGTPTKNGTATPGSDDVNASFSLTVVQ
jgi:hypothetical protein